MIFKIDSILEKPWYFQMAIFVAVAGLLYGSFWYFMTSGMREETAQLSEQVAKLQQDDARAQIASQRLNDFRATYAQAQADYEELKALLPEQRELTIVLQSVQDRARGRLSVRRFSPQEDVQQDFYSGKPVQIEVSGGYNSLGAFFAQMAAYERIVSVSDFKITQTPQQHGARTIDARFLLTAYYASAERLQNAAPRPAGQPSAPQGAGQTPAAR